MQINFQNNNGGFAGIVLDSRTRDLSDYSVLRLALNTNAAPTYGDVEVQIEDSANRVAKVFLSGYGPVSTTPEGWGVYEIPLSAYTTINSALDLTAIINMSFFNLSDTAGTVNALNGIIYVDDIAFVGLKPI